MCIYVFSLIKIDLIVKATERNDIEMSFLKLKWWEIHTKLSKGRSKLLKDIRSHNPDLKIIFI